MGYKVTVRPKRPIGALPDWTVTSTSPPELHIREINAALADRRIKAQIADLGGTELAGSPADFGKLIADETEKWAKVVKFAGIKVE